MDNDLVEKRSFDRKDRTMKIARIRLDGGRAAYAAVEPDGYRVVKGDPFGRIEFTGETVPAARAALLAPVVPPQVVAIGLN
jgi:hypothetical protein